MSTMNGHEGAKIYEFPRKLRSAGGGQPRRSQADVTLLARHVPVVEFGSGWYHDAAIRDTDRSRKP